MTTDEHGDEDLQPLSSIDAVDAEESPSQENSVVEMEPIISQSTTNNDASEVLVLEQAKEFMEDQDGATSSAEPETKSLQKEEEGCTEETWGESEAAVSEDGDRRETAELIMQEEEQHFLESENHSTNNINQRENNLQDIEEEHMDQELNGENSAVGGNESQISEDFLGESEINENGNNRIHKSSDIEPPSATSNAQITPNMDCKEAKQQEKYYRVDSSAQSRPAVPGTTANENLEQDSKSPLPAATIPLAAASQEQVECNQPMSMPGAFAVAPSQATATLDDEESKPSASASVSTAVAENDESQSATATTRRHQEDHKLRNEDLQPNLRQNNNGAASAEETKEEEMSPLLSGDGVARLPSDIEASEPIPEVVSNNGQTDSHIKSQHPETEEVSIVVAEQQPEPEEVPMVVAELVAPPVQAIQVLFDEGTGEDPEAQPDLNPEDTTGNNILRDQEHPLPSAEVVPTKHALAKVFFSKTVLGLIILFGIMAIAIPTSVHLSQQEQETADGQGTGNGFPYDCFTSTEDLIFAQVKETDQHQFIICPNTRIKIGVLQNPVANDVSIVNGDTPLMVMRENVEIRCGQDGSVHNNCVLEGGFMQVLLQPIAFVKSTVVVRATRTDNVTIQGITFTGQLLSDYTFGGPGLVVSNPGENIRLVDCLWENMTAPNGVVFVGSNPLQANTDITGMEPLLDQSAHLKIVNSTFRRITYDGTFMETWSQKLSLEGCIFEDIRLSAYSDSCIRGGEIWCQGLLYCMGESDCSIKNICVDGFEYAGWAPLLVADNNSQFNVTGTSYVNQLKVYPRASDAFRCQTAAYATYTSYENEWYEMDECIDDDQLGVTRTPLCTLPHAE